jgi:hypothetical protein
MPSYRDYAGRGVQPVAPILTGYKWTRSTAAPAAVTNRFVTSTNMKVGAYTVANSGTMPTTGARHVTVTHTGVTGTDTLGTLVVVGTDLSGATITETLTPSADTIVTGTKWFNTVTSVTGAGWVINTGNDTIVVGCDASKVCATAYEGLLATIVINATAAGTITIADSTGTIAVLPSSAAVGHYRYDVNWKDYLSVVQTAASDITVIHSESMPL